MYKLTQKFNSDKLSFISEGEKTPGAFIEFKHTQNLMNNLADVIKTRDENHVDYSAYFNAAQMQELLKLNNQIFALGNEYPKYLSCWTGPVNRMVGDKALTSIGVRQTILNQLNDANPARFNLISAHDITIVALSAILGNKLTTQPDYASDLKFLQFNDKSIMILLGHNTNLLKDSLSAYNYQYQIITPAQCVENSDKTCSFNEFKQILSN